MNDENVFCKLRRIARSVQNESALAQERMSRPAALRASGDSARPVLRRMRCDAHNTKQEVEGVLSSLPSQSELSNIVDSCTQLLDAYTSKANELQAYLQQYGYQPQHSGNIGNSSVKRTTMGDKKSADSSKGTMTRTVAQGSEEIPEKENIPTTPPKSSDLSSVGTGTPRLEDFGLSQGFLATMARNKLGSQQKPGQNSVQEGASLHSTFNKKASADVSTPFHSALRNGTCPFTPLGGNTTPARVTVTPGIFGGGELPSQTPTQFMDSLAGYPRTHGRNDADFSHPKKSLQFGSSYNKVTSSSILDAIPSHMTAEHNDGDIGTPPAPEMTARWNFTSIHAPQPQPLSQPPAPEPTLRPVEGEPEPPPRTHQGFHLLAADTPPTPELTMKWDSRTMPAMPVAPDRLTSRIHHQLMEEPVRLTSRLPSHTPEEPQLTSNKYGAPSSGETPETPLGLTGKLGMSKAFDLSTFLSEEMPKTPELTMSYARYISTDENAASTGGGGSTAGAVPPDAQSTHHKIPPPSQIVDDSYAVLPKAPVNVSFASISAVTEAEFESQNDYMRRILPLDYINLTVARMNDVLQEKANTGAAVCLTEADIQGLELGAKSRAILLFLSKLERLTSGGMLTGASQPGYYPVPR